jgi:hypothetical protein
VVAGGLVALSSDHSHFRFLIGSSMRQALAAKVSAGADDYALFFLAAGGGALAELRVEGALPAQFFPHGLAGDGGGTLVVVNHRSDRDFLEVFAVGATPGGGGGRTARHVGSASHELLFNVNDCAIESSAGSSPRVPPRNVVVLCTNWRSQTTGTLLDFVEVYAQMPWSNVVRCEVELDGVSQVTTTCSVVATGLKMSNGIEISQDGAMVAVVASLGREIVIYDVLTKDKKKKKKNGGGAFHALVEVRRIPTNAACDNLMWRSSATLLSGCHPHALTFAKYSTDPGAHFSPSEVIQVTIGDDAGADVVETVYLDPTGETISAATVAAIMDDGALYVGTVHDGGILKCPASSRTDPVPQALTREWSWGRGSTMVGLVMLFIYCCVCMFFPNGV